MTVRHWLGIPYARAARFQPPVVLPYDDTRDVSGFGPAAPQALDSPLGGIVPGMGVDAYDEHACLTVNVWSPADVRDLPVLVWFHGGSFVIGASSQPVYDGARLAAEQNVVVVSANYRLGALGFLDARPWGGVANCGVRDAIAALEWVHANVARFGGDPARVVPFGESAGGGLILHALAAASARGLVAGAIVQSGATFATLDADNAALVAEILAKEAGSDLATVPVDDLVAAQGRALSALLPTVGMMPFHPMIDGDVVAARPADSPAVVPLVAGTTAEEMRLFLDPNALSVELDRLQRRVARYCKVDGAQAGKIVATYARELGTNDGGVIWSTIFSDVEMQVPLRAVLDGRVAPTFAYLFTWGGPRVGACHGIDIPFAFDNYVDGWDAFVGLDDDGRALGHRIRAAWAAFARTGDPGWPQWPAVNEFGREQHVFPTDPFVRLSALAGC